MNDVRADDGEPMAALITMSLLGVGKTQLVRTKTAPDPNCPVLT
jgi:hypothetical protein